MKLLLFGGDGLPEGTHTWYDTVDADGRRRQKNAHPGERVPYDVVANAEYYIETKRATLIEDEVN